MSSHSLRWRPLSWNNNDDTDDSVNRIDDNDNIDRNKDNDNDSSNINYDDDDDSNEKAFELE